jgi:hypothetical protein
MNAEPPAPASHGPTRRLLGNHRNLRAQARVSDLQENGQHDEGSHVSLRLTEKPL